MSNSRSLYPNTIAFGRASAASAAAHDFQTDDGHSGDRTGERPRALLLLLGTQVEPSVVVSKDELHKLV